jgi:hypothetical protein
MPQQVQACPYRSQCYRGRGQPNEPAISGVGLVDSVRIVVAELVHNLRYSVVVLRLQGFANKGLELEGAALALIVELVVERFGDVGVHSDRGRQRPLHVAATGASSCERRAGRS